MPPALCAPLNSLFRYQSEKLHTYSSLVLELDIASFQLRRLARSSSCSSRPSGVSLHVSVDRSGRRPWELEKTHNIENKSFKSTMEWAPHKTDGCRCCLLSSPPLQQGISTYSQNVILLSFDTGIHCSRASSDSRSTTVSAHQHQNSQTLVARGRYL